MNGIGWAVKEMQNGRRVRRAAWNSENTWTALRMPDSRSDMSAPYVYIKTPEDKMIPWLCSQSDLLAVDWELF
jgi:Protein of unknown function (DUF2829)